MIDNNKVVVECQKCGKRQIVDPNNVPVSCSCDGHTTNNIVVIENLLIVK